MRVSLFSLALALLVFGLHNVESFSDDNQTWSHLLQGHFEESLERPVAAITTFYVSVAKESKITSLVGASPVHIDLASRIAPEFRSFHNDVHFNTGSSKKVARDVTNFMLATNRFNFAAEKPTA